MVSIFGASIYLMAQNLGIELKLDKFPDINIEYSTIEQIFSSISIYYWVIAILNLD